MSQEIQYSLVIPVYKNEDNIPALVNALNVLASDIPGSFEVVFVVDGSPDHSWHLLQQELPKVNFSSQLIVLSRNFGAFSAIRTGLVEAQGQYVAVMAADLQEPPELIIQFFEELASEKADVAFGQRINRKDPLLSKMLSGVFWGFYRRFVIKDVPKGGVDIFACNKKSLSAVLAIEEPNSSLIAQLFWIGFRRSFIPYTRQERKEGKSSWSFGRRFRYMLDSIFSFTDLPIMLLLWIGGLGLIGSFILMAVIVTLWSLSMITVQGYVPIILSILFFGSLTIFSQGILGSYLWRTLENTKKRPLSLILGKETFSGKKS